MPDDYQALLGEVGGQPVDQAASNIVAQSTTTEPITTEPGVIPGTESVPTDEVTDPANAEGTVIEEPQPAEDPNLTATNQAFAAMRSQNAKYQKAFARVAQAMGATSEDEAIEKIIGATFDVQAKRENVDPAILKRITELEEKNQMLDQATKEQFIRDSFGAVQKQFSLSDSELVMFAQKLTDQKVDIFNSNVPLSALYLGYYHDVITAKKLEEEKQNWIKGQSEADKAPGVNPATGKQSNKEKKEISTEADLDLVLKTLNN